MKMTVSKRKIEEKIRMIVPKGTHIRKDVLDSIQQIIDLKQDISKPDFGR